MLTTPNPDDVKIKFEAWLRPANFREKYSIQLEKRLTGTCDWVFNHNSFQEWLNGSTSASSLDRLLCISGLHGCGKSVMAASIGEHLKSQGHPVLYFPFSATDMSQQSLDDLARCFLWQAALKTWDGTADKISEHITSGQPLTAELWELFSYCIAKYQKSPVYCIIDGLDECKDSSLDLLRELRRITSQHQAIRTVILGRPHSMTSWPEAIRRLEIDSALNQGDIEAFTKSQFDTLEVVQSGETRDFALKTIQDKSNGMFLWVQLTIDDLRKSASRMEVKERLNNLPRGLEGAYRHILQRMVLELDDAQLRLANRILSFVVAAQRPMTVSELQHALALDAQLSSMHNKDSSLQDYMLINPTQKISNLCRAFLQVSATSVKVVHFSAVEFLLRSDDAMQEESKSLQQLFINNIPEVHGRLARASLHYLFEDDYNSQFQNSDELASALSGHPFLAYSSDNLAYHYNRVADIVDSDFSRLESFLLSTKSNFWFQKLGFTTLNNADFQMEEVSTLVRTIHRSHENERQFFQNVADHLSTELLRRKAEFGDDDIRTRLWISVLVGLASCVTHINFSDQFDRDMGNTEFVLPDEPQVTPPEASDHAGETAGSSSQQPASTASVPPRTALQDMHNELLALAQTSEPFAISVIPDLLRRALIASRRMESLKIVVDPLELLFRAILSVASKMPARILLVVSRFYSQSGKPAWALELCEAAFKKLENQDILLKYQVRYEMGHIERSLDHAVNAAAAYQYAYEGFKRFLRFSDSPTAWCFMNLLWQLYRLNRSEEAEALHRSAPDGWEKVCQKVSEVQFFLTMDGFTTLYTALGQRQVAESFSIKVCEATQDLLKTTEIPPTVLRSRIRALNFLRRYDEVKTMYAPLRNRQDPRFRICDTEDWCSIYGEYGNTLIALGDKEEAEKLAALVVELGEGVGRKFELRGENFVYWMEALYDLERFDEVQRVGRRFLDEGYDTILRASRFRLPDSLVRGLLYMGHSFYETGDYSQATEMYRRSMLEGAALNNGWQEVHEIAHAMLVRSLLGQQHYTEAQRTLRGFDFSRFMFEDTWEPLVGDLRQFADADDNTDREEEGLFNAMGVGLERSFGVTRLSLLCQMNEMAMMAKQGTRSLQEVGLMLAELTSKALQTFSSADGVVLAIRQWHVSILIQEKKYTEARKLLLVVYRDTENMSSIPRLDLDQANWAIEAFNFVTHYVQGYGSPEEGWSITRYEPSVIASDGGYHWRFDEQPDETPKGWDYHRRFDEQPAEMPKERADGIEQRYMMMGMMRRQSI